MTKKILKTGKKTVGKSTVREAPVRLTVNYQYPLYPNQQLLQRPSKYCSTRDRVKSPDSNNSRANMQGQIGLFKAILTPLTTFHGTGANSIFVFKK